MSQPDEIQPHGETSPLPAPTREKRRRKSHRVGSCFRAKVLLIGMFFILKALDIFVYFHTPHINKSALLGVFLNNTLWTVAFLAAIWFRKTWARYILILFLLLNIADVLMLVPDIGLQIDTNGPVLIIIGVCALVNTAVIWCLLFSHDLDRLTGRSHE